jgi:pimeloyl-ACP methyl ester carboxylesterase
MSFYEKGEIKIYYEESGQGYPLLLIAPGGMRSNIDFWSKSAYSPIVEFANDFRIIAMDQRNAGKSTAPITAQDGWESYTQDQLGLLDHLGIEKAHIMGGCIGSSYCKRHRREFRRQFCKILSG